MIYQFLNLMILNNYLIVILYLYIFNFMYYYTSFLYLLIKKKIVHSILIYIYIDTK